MKHSIETREGRGVKKCLTEAEPEKRRGRVFPQGLNCLYFLFFSSIYESVIKFVLIANTLSKSP